MADQSTRGRLKPPDLSEKGGLKNGAPQRSDERLFMQLLAFGGCHDVQAVCEALRTLPLETVVYDAPLEAFAEMTSRTALDHWAQASRGDLARFWRLSQMLNLHHLGRAEDRFMSYGSYGSHAAPLFLTA